MAAGSSAASDATLAAVTLEWTATRARDRAANGGGGWPGAGAAPDGFHGGFGDGRCLSEGKRPTSLSGTAQEVRTARPSLPSLNMTKHSK